MDKSKTYIKMCEGAEKIQDDWEPKVGDVFYRRDDRELIEMVYECEDDYYSVYPHRETDTWLPRQDQLQEMVGNYAKAIKGFYKFISVWTYSDSLENHPTYICGIGTYLNHDFKPTQHVYLSVFDSMEQLWLAFVMKEKYGKTWNGSCWARSM